MKCKKVAALKLGAVLLPLILASCHDIKNGDLDLTASPSNTIVIPAPAKTKSCDGLTDIEGAYFEFPKISFTWKTDGTVIIQVIKVVFQSSFLPGGAYECVLGGDDLISALNPIPTAISDNIIHTTSCGIRCGSMTFNDGVTSATGTGYIKVIATHVNADGQDEPIFAEAPVTFLYENR